MVKSNINLLTVASTSILGVVGCTNSSQVASQQPNIIYILADDLGYGDIGCYGSTKVETPHIDRLASQGLLFTQHYAGCTVSAPSRSSLLTGQHTGHTPIRGNRELDIEGQLPLASESFTIAEMLQKEGYKTGAFGKWGLGYPGSEGDPNMQGFEEFFGYNCQRQAHRYYPTHLWHNDEKVMLEGNDLTHCVTYAPDLIQEHVLDYIRENRDHPFFAYLAFVQPHAELLVPDDELLHKYQGRFEETPYIFHKEGGNYGSEEFDVSYFCDQKEPRATFAAMVSRLDRYVGEVMDTLEELGIAENTIVIFTSDNGPHFAGGGDPDFFNGNGPFRGYKRDLSDGGIRVPFIVKWSGVVSEGRRSDHISAFWDMMPTFAEIVGAELPSNIDGLSMVAELRGEPQQEHDFLYWEYAPQQGSFAVRMGDWKAIRSNANANPNSPLELFNIIEDPEELTNLASEHPDLVARAEEILQREHIPNKNYPFKYELFDSATEQTREKR